jgi:hypothetical protein
MTYFTFDLFLFQFVQSFLSAGSKKQKWFLRGFSQIAAAMPLLAVVQAAVWAPDK